MKKKVAKIKINLLISKRLSNQYKIKNDLKNEFKVIGSTCERYRFKIKPTY